MTINNCDLQNAMYRQEIYCIPSIAYFMCDDASHVQYNLAFTATDVASKIFPFLKAIYLKYQVMAKLLNQVVNKSFYVNPALTPQPILSLLAI